MEREREFHANGDAIHPVADDDGGYRVVLIVAFVNCCVIDCYP